MKIRVKSLLILILIVLIVSACAGNQSNSTENTSQSSGKSGYIQNKGSDTLVNLALAWAERYRDIEPNVSIAVTGGGSGTGIAALIICSKRKACLTFIFPSRGSEAIH